MKTPTNPKAYRDAVNAGKYPAPKGHSTNKTYFAAALGHKTPAAYRAYINGGA